MKSEKTRKTALLDRLGLGGFGLCPRNRLCLGENDIFF
jgi:hypothetical protein